MATQKRPLPATGLARAEIDRTLDGIFNEDYQDKAFDPAPGGGGVVWGGITGTLDSQADLKAALDAKVNLTDYSNVIVVDPNGKGDYTTLSAAFSAAPTGSLIVIFGPISVEEEITLTKTLHLWIPNRVAINTSITMNSGGNLSISGNGRFTSSDNPVIVNSGSLRLYPGTEFVTGEVVVNAGTIEANGVSISSLYFSNTANFRIRGSIITVLGFSAAMTPSVGLRYISGSIIDLLTCNVPWTNFPMYHCTVKNEPENVTVHIANFTNASFVDNSNWPQIP
jgi:hypothetical protein